jgi:hypothetical protein
MSQPIKIKLGEQELTLAEARELYQQLGVLFGSSPEPGPFLPGLPYPLPTWPAQPKDLSCPPVINWTSRFGTEADVAGTQTLSFARS